jgi:hypothetical protein
VTPLSSELVEILGLGSSKDEYLENDDLGDKQAAIKDFQTAANIYQKEGKETDYQDAMEKIKNLSK